MTLDLFGDTPGAFAPEPLAHGAAVLPGYATGVAGALLAAITEVAARAPFRQMKTPGGYTMSVAMTGCGEVCWVTDQTGYRYQAEDPLSGHPWPTMPEPFLRLAAEAAAAAGYRDFIPDACLINRYCPGSRMSLHQDRDERDFDQPIVSVSLGLPATFQFGGETRRVRPVNVPLTHGDVVVWGGPARLRYHGVLRLKQGWHPLTGEYRYNLTFRRAL